MSESQGYKLGMKLGLSDKSALFNAVRQKGTKREVDLLMEKGEANTAFRRGLKSAAFELSKGKRRPATRKKTTRKKTTRQRLTTARRPAAKRDVLDRSARSEALKVLKQKYVAEGYTKREAARLAREDLNALEVYLESGIDPKTGKAPRLKDIDYPGKRKRTSSSRKSSRPKYFSESQVEAWYEKVPRKVGRYEAYDSTTEYTTKEDMTSEERKDISVWYEIPGTDGAWILSQEYRDSPFVLSANDASERFSGTLAQMKKKLASISRRKSSSRKSSRKDRSVAQDWNQKETTKWFATLGKKIGNFKVWDSWVYAVVDQPVELRASYAGGSLEDPGMVWEITQIKGQPAVLTGQESGRGRSVERYTGTLAQMKKKLVAISRRKSSRGKGSTRRITRSKPTRMMSEQKFWPIVRSLQWRTAKTGVPDLENRSEKFQSLVSAGQRKPFDARLKQLGQKLDESIQAWVAQTGKRIPLGDDSYGDLLNHIIGLGKTEYTQTLRSPKRAFDRADSLDYVENFVYITFPPSRKRKNPEVSGARLASGGFRSRTGLARRGSEGPLTARDRRRSEDKYVKSLPKMLAELKAERAQANLPSYLIDFYDTQIAELEEELASYVVKSSPKTPRRKKGRRKRKNPDPSRINSDTNATVDGIEVSRVPDSPEKGVTEYYLIDFRGSMEETGPGGLWYDGAFAHRVPGGFLVVDGLAIHKFYSRLPTAAQVARLIGENYSGVTEDAYLIPKSGSTQFARVKDFEHYD